MGRKKLRIAMIAPPWLPVPPIGYGGIENVLAVLVPALIKLGVRVELFTVGDSKVKSNRNHWLYKTGQYDNIHRPMYDSLPIQVAHQQFALNTIRQDGKFDLIHDHNPFTGVSMTANLPKSMPPVLHTLHGPPFSTNERVKRGIPDNRPMWQQLEAAKRIFYSGISRAQMRHAPSKLRKQILPVVYNGVDVEAFPYVEPKPNKRGYFITLARFSPDKGQHIAVEACLRLGATLKMAGNVADLTTSRQVMSQLANPASQYRGLTDFRYFSDKIFPHLDDKQISYLGSLADGAKLRLLSRARALLFPIQWDEPFGMAAIEALACGTPVVAMARGALPEIIKHGFNGFLAKTKREFYQYVGRVGEIDPAACRQSVIDKFSAEQMAASYLDRYRQVLKLV